MRPVVCPTFTLGPRHVHKGLWFCLLFLFGPEVPGGVGRGARRLVCPAVAGLQASVSREPRLSSLVGFRRPRRVFSPSPRSPPRFALQRREWVTRAPRGREPAPAPPPPAPPSAPTAPGVPETDPRVRPAPSSPSGPASEQQESLEPPALTPSSVAPTAPVPAAVARAQGSADGEAPLPPSPAVPRGPAAAVLQ